MTEFTLKKREADTLKLNIGDESYHIPLAGSLTPSEAAGLDTGEGTIAFLNKYLPKEITDALTVNEYNEITHAWAEASKKASGKTVGES